MHEMLMNEPPSWDGDVESWDVECNECNEFSEAQRFHASGSHPKVFRGLGLARGSGSNRRSLHPRLWTCRFGGDQKISKVLPRCQSLRLSFAKTCCLLMSTGCSRCSLHRGAPWFVDRLLPCRIFYRWFQLVEMRNLQTFSNTSQWAMVVAYCWLLFRWVIVDFSAIINHHLLLVITVPLRIVRDQYQP